MNSAQLLERLIGFPSVSSQTNLPLVAFVRDYLAQRGVEATLIPDATGAKANLFATIGPGDKPGVILSGHTDVVPVDGQAWSSDPFILVERDGCLFGRGAADMKGFIACALRAANLATGRSLATPLHLALSHDEEIGCVGVRSMLDVLAAAPVKPRLCIVGEPTSLAVARRHKGKIAARATFCGVEAHSSLAPRALNAIHLAVDFVDSLRRRQAALAAGGVRDDYDVPYTTVHAGIIRGGATLNIVPNRAVVDFEIRNVPADDAGDILAAIRDDANSIAAAHRQRFPAASARVEVVNEYPGLDMPEDSNSVAFVQGLLEGAPTTKVAFGAEGGLFRQRLGVPTVVCGPGSMEQGHKPDEFVSRAQLDACDRMMDRLLYALA